MNTLFSNSRNRDFLRICRKTLADMRQSGCNPSAGQLIDKVLAGRAPCYYVDYFNACHILIRALKHGRVEQGVYKCTECWEDMYRDLLELLRLHPTRPLRGLILSLCAGEAGNPRFYISRRRAYEIIKPYFKTDF